MSGWHSQLRAYTLILHSLLKNRGAISNITKSFLLARVEASEKLGCVSTPSSELKNIKYKAGLISSYNQNKLKEFSNDMYAHARNTLLHIIMHILYQGQPNGDCMLDGHSYIHMHI